MLEMTMPHTQNEYSCRFHATVQTWKTIQSAPLSATIDSARKLPSKAVLAQVLMEQRDTERIPTMTDKWVWLLLLWFVIIAGCGGDGGTPVAQAAASACVAPPASVKGLQFYTAASGSTYNGQALLSGVFSTSFGGACTAQDRQCLIVENVRVLSVGLVELFGFGFALDGQVDLLLSSDGGLSGTHFSGTAPLNPPFQLTVSDAAGTVLVLIGGAP